MPKKKAARQPVDLTAKVREFKDLKLQLEYVEDLMAQVKGEITAEMSALGVDEVKVGVFTVSYKPVVSSKFDSAAFKKTHEELYRQYCKESSSMRFTVA